MKVVSETRVTWATYVPILVFLGLSVLELDPMYATDRVRRQTDVRQKHATPYGGGGIIRQLITQLRFIISRISADWPEHQDALYGHGLAPYDGL